MHYLHVGSAIVMIKRLNIMVAVVGNLLLVPVVVRNLLLEAMAVKVVVEHLSMRKGTTSSREVVVVMTRKRRLHQNNPG